MYLKLPEGGSGRGRARRSHFRDGKRESGSWRPREVCVSSDGADRLSGRNRINQTLGADSGGTGSEGALRVGTWDGKQDIGTCSLSARDRVEHYCQERSFEFLS